MNYTIYVTDEGFEGNPVLANGLIDQGVADEEENAISMAKQFAGDYPEYQTYIFFSRNSDGQTGFLNPNGYDPVHAQNWAE